MLRSLVILALLASLGANAWYIARSQNPPLRSHRVDQTTKSSSVAKTQAQPFVSAIATCAIPKTSDDYRALRARLEHDGLHPRIAKVVLAVLLEHDFASRSVIQSTEDGDYWRHDTTAMQRRIEAVFEIKEEKRTLEHELGIGAVLNNPWSELDGSVRFGKLSPEKRVRLQQILADYGDLREENEGASSADDAAGHEAREALLARELRADIERTLTPAELREFDYRNSPVTQRLRNTFGEFAATEAEFVALYPQIEILLNNTEAHAGTQALRVEDQIESAVRQTLGEPRYQELRETNNRPLQSARHFLTEASLPLSLASDLITMDQEFSARHNKLWQDRDITLNQRDRQIEALDQERRQRLSPLLGPHAETYAKRYGLSGDMSIGCGGTFDSARLL